MRSPDMNAFQHQNSPAVADGGLRGFPAEDPYPCDIDVFPSSMHLESGQEDLRDLLQEMRDGPRPWNGDGGASFGEFEAGMTLPGMTAGQWGSGMQGFCAPSEAAAVAQQVTDTAGTPFHPAYMGAMPFGLPQDGNNAAAAGGQPAPMAYAPQYAVRPPPQWETHPSFQQQQQQGMAGPGAPPPGAVMYCSMPPPPGHPAYAGAPPGYAYSYGYPGPGMPMQMQMQGYAPPPGMAMHAPPPGMAMHAPPPGMAMHAPPPQAQQGGGPGAAFPMACTFVFPPGAMHMQPSMVAAPRHQPAAAAAAAAAGLVDRAQSLPSSGASSGDEGAPTPPRQTVSSSDLQVVPEVNMSRQHSGQQQQQQCGMLLPQMDAGRFGGAHVMLMPYGREVVLMRQAVPSVTGRQASLERYREKKARRSYSKNIRYHMRKVNADRRPRVKGRFIKAGEVAEAAERMNNEMAAVADGDVSS